MWDAAHLAELEAAAWKDDRRFRLITVDRGVTSFSDLYFNTPTKVKRVPPAAVPGRTTDGYSVSSLGAQSVIPCTAASSYFVTEYIYGLSTGAVEAYSAVPQGCGAAQPPICAPMISHMPV